MRRERIVVKQGDITFLDERKTSVETVHLVLFDRPTFETFRRTWQKGKEDCAG